MIETGDTPDWLVPFSPRAIRIAAKRLARHDFVTILATRDDDLSSLPPSLAGETDMARMHRDPAGFQLRRRIARALIGAVMDQPAETVALTKDTNGALVIVPPSGGLHLSFASSNGVNLVGLARQPIGGDLEVPLALDAIPWNILRNDERETILRLPEAARSAAFLQLWMRKEAYLKAIGTGFHLPPETIQIRNNPETGDPEVFHSLLERHEALSGIVWLETEVRLKKLFSVVLVLLPKSPC